MNSSSLDYNGIAADVTDVLKDVGMPIIIKSLAGGDAYDPVSGEDPTTPVPPGTEVTVNGVRFGIDVKYAQKVGVQNIQTQDELVYIEPSVMVPSMEDQVNFGEGWWSVVRVEKYAPTNIPVLYILQVRP